MALLTFNTAAVKQGRWSPILTPLSHTAVPNCALLIPRPVAFLARYSRVINDGAFGKLAVAHPVLNQHPAIELVDLRKCRLGRVRKSRHWSFTFPNGRNRLGISRIFNVPHAVE